MWYDPEDNVLVMKKQSMQATYQDEIEEQRCNVTAFESSHSCSCMPSQEMPC